MKKLIIKAPKTYEKNGEQKTYWLNVGTITDMEDGKNVFVELNMCPNQQYRAFPFEPSKPLREPEPQEAQSNSFQSEEIDF